jgi:arabinofuranosyltransferase
MEENPNQNSSMQPSEHSIRSRFLRAISKFDRNSWKFSLLTGVVITLISIIYVQSVMAKWGVYGFSFDDSWIHVQYARTIFEGRPWQYAWGIPSTGSSGPLWSVILSPIFIFGYDHDTVVTSVLIIAAVLYIIDVFLVGEIVRQHTHRWQYVIVGQVIFVLVPRNGGLMLSGMETPLGMMLILLALLLLPRPEMRYDPVLGIVAGLAYLCRPEFVLIAALCLPIRSIAVLYRDRLKKERILTVFAMFALAALVVLPWVLQCYSTTGLPLADSYYSKMRWGVTQEAIDLWDFFWFQVWFLSEPYLVLGFLGAFALLVIKRRPYELILGTALYALYRLTMPSMSLLFAARYLVPLFDILSVAFTCGIAVIIERFIRAESLKKPKEIEFRTLMVVFILLLLFFPSIISNDWYTNVHANQTKNIEEMQVNLSIWIRENVPDDAVIATYDVGAIGFFARGRVLDQYGLVTPPLLHNYTTLSEQADYLKEMNCTYIMYYVEWFQWLRFAIMNKGGLATELYRAHLDDNVVCGTDNMAVYSITW